MDSAEIWQLLERGGLPRPELSATGAGEARAAVQLPKYNGLADPGGAERLGRALAERAAPLQPTLVLLWEDHEDVVLGHIVGRELSVPVVRSYNADGLVGYAGDFPRGARVLLVADAFRDPTTLPAMRSLVEQQGGTLAGAAVLVETDALAAEGEPALRTVSLSAAATEVSGGNGTR